MSAHSSLHQEYSLAGIANSCKHRLQYPSLSQEVAEANDIFNESRSDPALNKNAAPHSGAVAWARGLLERVAEPMTKIQGLSSAVLEGEEAQATMA